MTDLAISLPKPIHAVENVLVAGHGIQAALKPGHPPFWIERGDLAPADWERASIAAALVHYGPGPVFDLWTALRAISELRLVWTGER